MSGKGKGKGYGKVRSVQFQALERLSFVGSNAKIGLKPDDEVEVNQTFEVSRPIKDDAIITEFLDENGRNVEIHVNALLNKEHQDGGVDPPVEPGNPLDDVDALLREHQHGSRYSPFEPENPCDESVDEIKIVGFTRPNGEAVSCNEFQLDRQLGGFLRRRRLDSGVPQPSRIPIAAVAVLTGLGYWTYRRMKKRTIRQPTRERIYMDDDW